MSRRHAPVTRYDVQWKDPAPAVTETGDLRKAVEASMNDLGLGTPERVERARLRLAAALEAVEASDGR